MKLSLGKYVTWASRKRADGTYNVLFEVPARLRPSGWPPTIPLPRGRPRRGNLSDGEEVAAIQREAAALLAQLQAIRGGRPVSLIKPGTLAHFVDLWRAHESWTSLAPRSVRTYNKAIRVILAWEETNGGKPARSIDAKAVRAFLGLYNDRRSMQKLLRATLSQIFAIAVEDGSLAANPVEKLTPMRARGGVRRKRPVDLWTAETIDLYAAIAREKMGWEGGAILLRAMWETSADAADVVSWRKGKGGHFKDGARPAIDYNRGKTGVPSRVPISAALAAAIRALPSTHVVTDPFGVPYGGPEDDARRDGHLAKLRDLAVTSGAPRLIYDHIRHSVLTDAVAHGASYEAAGALAAHTDEAMARRNYVQATEERLAAVQRARGIIE